MRKLKKRALALLLAAVLVCGTLPYGAAFGFIGFHMSASVGYGSDWRCWSQGSSEYSAMSSGCRVVSYSKLLAECGIVSPPGFNPDTLFEWGCENGFWSKNSVYENGTCGVAPVKYAESLGKTLVREGTASLSGSLEQQAETIMRYIKNGYYVIATCSAHYVYVGRAASLAADTPVVMNSGGNVADGASLIQQYVSPPKGWSYNYTGIIYYSCAETTGDGNVVEFGSYPQSEVTDPALVARLNSHNAQFVSYGYYSGNGSIGSMEQSDCMKYADISLDGEKYRAVTFSACRPAHTSYPHTDPHPNGYCAETVYWFRFEPLRWCEVDGTDFLLCENVVDSQAFSNTVYGSSPLCSDSSLSMRADDYSQSSIRQWLNNDFLNTAFSASERLSLDTVALENGVRDKVFLPALDDMQNETAVGGSGYALMQGFSKGSGQLLRTPGDEADMLCAFGSQADSVLCYDSSCGIRPAIKISVIPAAGVAFTRDCSDIQLTAGETKLLAFSVSPGKSRNYTVEYSVSNPAVAAVNSLGMLAALGKGEAVVTVTVHNANGSIVTGTTKLTVKSSEEKSTLDFWVKLITLAGRLLLLLLNLFA